MFAQALCKSFGRAFSKARAGGGRAGLLAARRRRNSPNGVFFLITFSFAPLVSKEKVAEDVAVIKGKPHLWFPLFFLRKNSPLRALTNDQEFRALRSARRAPRPPPAPPFEKGGRKLLHRVCANKEGGETPLVVSPIILMYPKSDGRKREIRETPFPPCKRIRCDVTR